MAYLIINVEDVTYSMRAPVGDRVVIERVRDLAARHGYEVRFEHRKTFADRAEWPLTLFAYTSQRKDGHGRTGSQAYNWAARAVTCVRCDGTGKGPLGGSCKGCRGTGRGRPSADRPKALPPRTASEIREQVLEEQRTKRMAKKAEPAPAAPRTPPMPDYVKNMPVYKNAEFAARKKAEADAAEDELNGGPSAAELLSRHVAKKE